MKKHLTIALLCCLPVSNAFAEPDQDSGCIFIRTLRGDSSAVRTDDKIITLAVNDTAYASNVQIKAGKDDFASFALSNRSGGVFKGQGAILITQFKHKSTVTNDVNIEEEAVPSDVEIYLEEGDLTISRAQPRPSSRFIISTPFGSFHCIGREIKISVTGNSATAYAYKTPFNFYPEGIKDPQYIGVGYSVTAFKQGANISLRREQFSAESKEFAADFVAAENAWRSTIFSKHPETEELYGRRLVQNTFHLKRPIIPRRR